MTDYYDADDDRDVSNYGQGVKCPACEFSVNNITGKLDGLEAGDPCPACGEPLRWLDGNEIAEIYEDFMDRED